MQSIYFYLIFLLVVVLLIGRPEFNWAQVKDYATEDLQVQTFDEDAWRGLKAGIDYTRGSKERKKDETDEGQAFDPPPVENPFALPKVLSAILKIILIVVIAVLLALLIKNLLGKEARPANKKVKSVNTVKAIDLEHIEEQMDETDLMKLVEAAIKQGRYPLAIRLYYLEVLKVLKGKKLIKWKKDKTNKDYSRELKSSPFYYPFGLVTKLFERIWYGNQTLDKEDFEKNVLPEFQTLVQAVQAITEEDRPNKSKE